MTFFVKSTLIYKLLSNEKPTTTISNYPVQYVNEYCIDFFTNVLQVPI